MRFVVSTTLLQQKLQRIQGVVSTNTVLPILEDFHFDIQQGTLTVRATDLETSMRTSLEVEASENGSVAIPAKILLDTLKTLPEQPITISFDEETYGVEIHSENGKYKLAGENPEEFPALPVLEDPFSMDVPSDSLIRGIQHTLFAVSNDELRPATSADVKKAEAGATAAGAGTGSSIDLVLTASIPPALGSGGVRVCWRGSGGAASMAERSSK
ncbi:MAG: DNA polymerase III subunit beta [Bacteroidota bacterium]|nr:DNA polymerase III subunit beta [Bacteroidota bacterium]